MTGFCKVSVIMPCFNHGEFLPEAVASVNNIQRRDIELIVVDDGSTDERTRKEMEALSTQGINVVRQENKGLAAARNAGVLASQGEYIFPLDADDRMRGGWLARAVGIGCQFKDLRTGIFGWAPWSTVGDSRTCPKSFSSIGGPSNPCSLEGCRSRTRSETMSRESTVYCIGRLGCRSKANTGP